MGFNAVKHEDIVFMFDMMDLDGSGQIEYKEFIRKLRRAGVTIRQAE